MKIIGWSTVILILVGVLMAAGWGINWAVRYYTAEPKGQLEAREQIQSAPFRISAYNFFFDLCAAIQGHEISLDALNKQLTKVTRENEKERILSTIAGLEGQRGRSISEYNAAARKDYTIGQFKD